MSPSLIYVVGALIGIGFTFCLAARREAGRI